MPAWQESRLSSKLFRRFASWFCAIAGLILLVVLLLRQEEGGIPGWQPANEALRATLAANETGQAVVGATALPSTDSASASSVPVSASTPSDTAPTADFPASVAGADLQGRLDLNMATAAELEQLPGIGPAKARAIVEYRSTHRGFKNVEQLREVSGIGPKLYERLEPLVAVVPPSS